MRARYQLAISGSYTAASGKRRSLKGWVSSTLRSDTDADEALLDDLPTLRAESRDLSRNTALAGGAINTVCTSVVGPGLRVKPEIDQDYLGLTEEQAAEFESNAKRIFETFSESKDCDITRTQNFYELEDLVFRSTLEGGDCFTLLPGRKPRKHFPFRTRLQILEAERVENPDFAADTETIAGGIEKDSDGAPKTYHILKYHPGSRATGTVSEWIPYPAFGARTGRRNVLHHYRRLRPGQSRGIPYLASVIEPFRVLGKYTEAELMAAVVAAMFTVFVKSEGAQELDVFTPSSETGGSPSDQDYRMANGAIVTLDQGEDIEIANPGRPNALFDPFVMSIIGQIGVNLELPREIVMKHFTASYSASRGAVMEAWRFFMSRRAWLATSFCQPVYSAVIDESVASGMLVAPGYLSDPMTRRCYLKAKWVGRPQGQLDPLKEANADKISASRAWKTDEEITLNLTGGDWFSNQRQKAIENKLMRESGMVDQDGVIEEDEQEDTEE